MQYNPYGPFTLPYYNPSMGPPAGYRGSPYGYPGVGNPNTYGNFQTHPGNHYANHQEQFDQYGQGYGLAPKYGNNTNGVNNTSTTQMSGVHEQNNKEQQQLNKQNQDDKNKQNKNSTQNNIPSQNTNSTNNKFDYNTMYSGLSSNQETAHGIPGVHPVHAQGPQHTAVQQYGSMAHQQQQYSNTWSQ